MISRSNLNTDNDDLEARKQSQKTKEVATKMRIMTEIEKEEGERMSNSMMKLGWVPRSGSCEFHGHSYKKNT